MIADADHYEAYYTAKLWALLPEVYRAEDRASEVDSALGPLQELVARLGAQAAVLRRSIDRLWEDQSIETCDDWVIAYIGDLLATKVIAGLDARAQRLDVAKTIYYRRSKGTVALLEELAHDVTQWDARVVEMFRRLGRTRSMLDPAFGPALSTTLLEAERLIGRRTRTPTGGTARLRDVAGALAAHGAFDEFAHTVDVRRGNGARGLHNIPKLAIFLWRLYSVPARQVVPVAYRGCPDKFAFDPTGRETHLFAKQQLDRYGKTWVSPLEDAVPGPLSAAVLADAFSTLYGELVATEKDTQHWALTLVPTGIAPYSVPRSRVTAEAGSFAAGASYLIDPELGCFYRQSGVTDGELLVSFHHGFASRIGAGGYDRRMSGKKTARPGALTEVHGGAAGFVATVSSGAIVFKDSLTYASAPSLTVDGEMLITAENRERPLIRFTSTPETWLITGNPGARIRIEGLIVSRGDVVLAGEFDEVTIDACTFDPGGGKTTGGYEDAVDQLPLRPCTLRIEGSVRALRVIRSILGPVVTTASGSVEEVVMEDAIVQGVRADAADTTRALELASGDLTLRRVTVLGEAQLHRLSADACVFSARVEVEDQQSGCVRFSAWVSGSVLPRRFQCVEVSASEAASLFVSQRFGDETWATLSLGTRDSIRAGAEDGSEMGAFSREQRPIKERSLLLKLGEYMPIGLTPQIVYVT